LIDIHAHVLPGLDDGPATLDDSIALLRAAARDGTRTIVATPHLRADYPDVDVRRLAAMCATVQAALPADVPIAVVPGGEIDLLWALDASDEQLRLASLGQSGRYLLIETPHRELDSAFERLLFAVAARGFAIVLAHPEVNPTFQRDVKRLKALAARGVALQVTARSLMPRRASRARRVATELVRAGMAHVVASDAHSGGPWRAPTLSGGVEAARRISPGRADWMVHEAPAAILDGRGLPSLPRDGATAFTRLLRFGVRA
jgi:protein-tyrosine phosphatase